MRRFSGLLRAIGDSPSINDAAAALTRYLRDAPAADAAWAIHLLMGRHRSRTMTTAELRALGIRASGIPEWLFDECLGTTSDTLEAVALLVGQIEPGDGAVPTLTELMARLGQIDRPDDVTVLDLWASLDRDGVLALNRILAGTLRAEAEVVVGAVMARSGRSRAEILRRLDLDREPTAAMLGRLLTESVPDASDAGSGALPLPFAGGPRATDRLPTGDRREWHVEERRAGIRAQLVVRGREIALWSEAGDKIDGAFDELVAAARALPSDTVIEGTIVARSGDLRRREGRARASAQLRREVPVELVASDALVIGGTDLRWLELGLRRARLEALLPHAGGAIAVAPELEGEWSTLEAIRRERGLVIRARTATYGDGAEAANLAWGPDPRRILALLLYATEVSGGDGDGGLELSLGLRAEAPGAGVAPGQAVEVVPGIVPEIVPIGRVSDRGLPRADRAALDAWIDANVREKFGPVRSVAATQVIELECESVVPAARRKAGIRLVGARLIGWRRDLDASRADAISVVKPASGPESAPRPAAPQGDFGF